jgi:predicted nucleic acid-binding protein
VLVIDASVAIAACHTPVGFARFRGHKVVAPELMVLAACSVFHEMARRKETSKERAKQMLTRLLKDDIEILSPCGLTEAAWDDELEWPRPTTHSMWRLHGCSIASW